MAEGRDSAVTCRFGRRSRAFVTRIERQRESVLPGRSIPIAIVFDADMNTLGWWGPRPGPAQALFRDKIREYKAGRLTDKREEVNKPVLTWYRLDRGRHTIDEFLTILERGGVARP